MSVGAFFILIGIIFAVTPQNPYQETYAGNRDLFVTKLSPSGDTLAYSTYLGGGGDDYGRGIAVDGSGNAYVTGYTYSTNFPTQNPYQGTRAGNNYDAFVTKLSSSGNTLAYSTYLGGGSDHDYGCGITIDAMGSAYVTGETYSTDFPTQTPYQAYYAGGPVDAFVTKLSPSGSTLAYSTYLGGTENDFGYDIAVDTTGNAYVLGSTASSNFPTENPYQATNAGSEDAFVAKFASETTYTYYIPCYKADPVDYYSSLALRNSSTTTAATVTVAAYQSDGTPVDLSGEATDYTDFPINPSGQWAAVLPRTEVEGWVRVTSDQPLTGLAWVGELDGPWPRLMADITLIDELHGTLVVPHVAQTIAGWNPNGGWSTKVNVCNPQTTQTDVTITYYSAAGAALHTTTESIPARGSISYNLADLLPTDQSFENGSVLIEATQPVAAFALYYDVDKVPGGDGTCYAGISAVAP